MKVEVDSKKKLIYLANAISKYNYHDKGLLICYFAIIELKKLKSLLTKKVKIILISLLVIIMLGGIFQGLGSMNKLNTNCDLSLPLIHKSRMNSNNIFYYSENGCKFRTCNDYFQKLLNMKIKATNGFYPKLHETDDLWMFCDFSGPKEILYRFNNSSLKANSFKENLRNNTFFDLGEFSEENNLWVGMHYLNSVQPKSIKIIFGYRSIQKLENSFLDSTVNFLKTLLDLDKKIYEINLFNISTSITQHRGNIEYKIQIQSIICSNKFKNCHDLPKSLSFIKKSDGSFVSNSNLEKPILNPFPFPSPYYQKSPRDLFELDSIEVINND